MKRSLLLLIVPLTLSAYKRECYVNYDPEKDRIPFYGRPASYIFSTTADMHGLFVYPDQQYYLKRRCGEPRGCIKRIYRRCKKPKAYPVVEAPVSPGDVSTCFVQLSKVDTDQLYADFLRFDPQTYLDELEFFQNSLVATVAEEVTLMKKMDNPNARAQVYDILDLLNNYTS